MLNRNKIFKTVRDTTNSLNVSTGKKMDNFYTELMTYEDMVQKRYDKIKDVLNTIKYHHNKIENLDRNYTNAIFGGGGKSLDDLLKNVEDVIETIETLETEKLQEFESFKNLAAKITTLEAMNVLKPKDKKPKEKDDDTLPDINGNQVKASDSSYFKEAKEALSSLDTLFNSDNTKIDKALEKIERIKDPIVQYIKDYKLSREFIEVIKKGIIELKKQADTFRKNQKLKLDKYKNIIKEGDTRAIQAVKDDEDPNKDIDRKILQAYDENRKNLKFKYNKDDDTGQLLIYQNGRVTNKIPIRYENTQGADAHHLKYNSEERSTTIKKVNLNNSGLPPIFVLINTDKKITNIDYYYFDIDGLKEIFSTYSNYLPNLEHEISNFKNKNKQVIEFIEKIKEKILHKNLQDQDVNTQLTIIPEIVNELITSNDTIKIPLIRFYENIINQLIQSGNTDILEKFNINYIKDTKIQSDDNINKLFYIYGSKFWHSIIDIIDDSERNSGVNLKAELKTVNTNFNILTNLKVFSDKVFSDKVFNKTQKGGSDQIEQLKKALNKIKTNINENIDKEDRVKQNQNQPKTNQPKQNDIVKSAKTMFGADTQQDDEDNKITNSIISSIIENYEKERSSVNTIEDKIKLDTKFVDILDNLGLNLSDIFKINFEDKLAFIFFILILHIVVYSIVESLIMNDYLTDIVYIMAVYVGVYFLIMFILILILNKYVNYRMKSALNYLNTDFNMQLITMHLFIVFMFYIIVLILSQHIDIFVAKEEDDKLQILYRIEVISSIIFIFSGVFVMLL
tara:strand:- start:717 stop:3095 length:2379 start_codon:yes stop_codon:yes gene_type:complete